MKDGLHYTNLNTDTNAAALRRYHKNVNDDPSPAKGEVGFSPEGVLSGEIILRHKLSIPSAPPTPSGLRPPSPSQGKDHREKCTRVLFYGLYYFTAFTTSLAPSFLTTASPSPFLHTSNLSSVIVPSSLTCFRGGASDCIRIVCTSPGSRY
jgi:hypothetical protein